MLKLTVHVSYGNSEEWSLHSFDHNPGRQVVGAPQAASSESVFFFGRINANSDLDGASSCAQPPHVKNE
jgi:hypothetical protein